VGGFNHGSREAGLPVEEALGGVETSSLRRRVTLIFADYSGVVDAAAEPA